MVLAERESRLSVLQRLTLVDIAASWLSEPAGGDQLAHALLAAACLTEVTVEHAYSALITHQAIQRVNPRTGLVVANPYGRAPPVQAHAQRDHAGTLVALDSPRPPGLCCTRRR
jgi:hypothetical protein